LIFKRCIKYMYKLEDKQDNDKSYKNKK